MVLRKEKRKNVRLGIPLARFRQVQKLVDPPNMVAGEIEGLGRIFVARLASDLEQVSRQGRPEMTFAANSPRSFDAMDLAEKMEVPLGIILELVT